MKRVKGMARSLSMRLATALLVSLAAITTGCATTTQPTTAQVLRTQPQVELRDPSTIKPPYTAAVVPHYAPPIFRAIELHPEWIPPTKARAWKYIVIHHSATPNGSAAKFDIEHRAKGWDELGYHFVIDNGNGGPDGRIEIGTRWGKQKHGAHAKTPDERFNEFGIGICLVGNFENTSPTSTQYHQLAELVAWLQERYAIPSANVIGHNDTKPTACPGRHLSVASIRSMAGEIIAAHKAKGPAIATAGH